MLLKYRLKCSNLNFKKLAKNEKT